MRPRLLRAAYPALLLRAAWPALLLLAAPPARADSIRCDGGIVSAGDSKLDLLGKCGTPSLREVRFEGWPEWRVIDAPAGLPGTGDLTPVVGRPVAASSERWTYNFGPNAFLLFVTVEEGTVTRVERGGYGRNENRSGAAVTVPRARCEHSSFRVGESTFEVLARCGQPATRDLKLLERVDFGPDPRRGTVFTTRVVVEAWVYDFGPRLLARRVEFCEGTLVRVETVGYGYSR